MSCIPSVTLSFTGWVCEMGIPPIERHINNIMITDFVRDTFLSYCYFLAFLQTI